MSEYDRERVARLFDDMSEVESVTGEHALPGADGGQSPRSAGSSVGRRGSSRHRMTACLLVVPFGHKPVPFCRNAGGRVKSVEVET